MRYLILLIGFLFLSLGTFAQKATYKKDTIYKDNKPYALLKASGSAILGQDYSLQTLSGKEVAYFKIEPTNGGPDSYYYLVIFRETGRKANIPITETRKSIAREVVMNDMVTADGINPEGERRFVQIYDKDLSRAPQINNPTNNNNANFNYQMVERERKGEVKVMGGDIEQNFTEIGRYEKDRDVSKSAYIFRITLPDGTKIAEATWVDRDTSCKLVTLKDNKLHSVYLSKTTFDSDIIQQIAAYLVERYYL
jgi:hypothetical protein